MRRGSSRTLCCIFRTSFAGICAGEGVEQLGQNAEPGRDGGARVELYACHDETAGVRAFAICADDEPLCDRNGSVARWAESGPYAATPAGELRRAGYTSNLSGKWHLAKNEGDKPEHPGAGVCEAGRPGWVRRRVGRCQSAGIQLASVGRHAMGSGWEGDYLGGIAACEAGVAVPLRGLLE